MSELAQQLRDLYSSHPMIMEAAAELERRPLVLTVAERELIIEALYYRAARHEAYAKSNPRNAGPHDRKAEAMRRLHDRLVKHPDRAG